MDEGLTEIAAAKINLALHVRRRRPDGYHDIESLFAFARDGDVLHARSDSTLSLAIIGPFAGPLTGEGDNLVLRAARALAEATGYKGGAAITLDKRLPVASGIGGGSADAAATLRLLNRLWGSNFSLEHLAEIGAPLGADVPACVMGQTLRGAGIGTEMSVIERPLLSGSPLLLVNPLIGLSTAPVFRGWDGVDRGPLPCGSDLDALRQGRNDLEIPAIAIVPQIAELLTDMRAMEPNARMSGSGATCFAIFADAAARDASALALHKKFPDHWMLKTHVA